jgi:RNA polymerase sigma-70 factor, ECF subfamily
MPGDAPFSPAMTPAMSDDARDAQAALAARTDSAAAPSAHAAFARIYDRHSAVVRALCLRHVPTDADDALQETFIRAYRLLHEAAEAESLRPWLYAIARHVCAERRRAAARRHKHEIAAAEDRIAMNGTRGHNQAGGTARIGTPPDPAEHAETLSRLSGALDELPDDERLAIHLYYLDPDPIIAAGSALGVSRSGFYKLLARARTHLASILGSVAP